MARALPDSASPPRSCSTPATLPPGGLLAVDTSGTPRSNEAAEILALEAGGELVAPLELHQRVTHELSVLRTYWPGQAHGYVVGCGVDSDLLVFMTDAGKQQVADGQYTAWDDYNDHLGLSGRVQKSYGYKLTFSGLYNLATLRQEYGLLPEVRAVDSNGWVGGSVDACLERFGDAADTHVYIFWQGSGDCQAGCINSLYYGFATDQSGAMEYLGGYNGSGSQPDWFAKAQQCRNFL